MKCKWYLKKKAVAKSPVVSTVSLQKGKAFLNNKLQMGLYLGAEVAAPFPEDHGGVAGGCAALVPRAAEFSTQQPTGLRSWRRTAKCPFWLERI